MLRFDVLIKWEPKPWAQHPGVMVKQSTKQQTYSSFVTEKYAVSLKEGSVLK